MKLGELNRTNVKSNIFIGDDEEELFSDGILDLDLSELRLITDKFGKYSIYELNEEYFVCDETDLIIHATVYEHHGHNLMLEKGLFIIYGWEDIICIFNDGTLKSIATR